MEGGIPTTVMAMAASELHRMIPEMQVASSKLHIDLTTNAQNNRFTLRSIKPHRSVHPRFQIDLPLLQDGQVHPSCQEFFNITLCSFLRTHIGTLEKLVVCGSHQIPQFLPNLLAALIGKGMTDLSLFNYTGELSSHRREVDLDLLFRPLLSLSVIAAEEQDESTCHSELGRLISLSTDLEKLRFGAHHRFTDAGFINILSGVYSLQNLSLIHLCDIHLDEWQMHTLKRFFDIVKSLQHHEKQLSFAHGSISLEGDRATYFWTQLMQLPNISLALEECFIPNSVAPLINSLLTGSGCQVTRLDLKYEYEGWWLCNMGVLEAFYSGVGLNESIKRLNTATYRSGSKEGRQLQLATCNMIKANTTLTQIGLYGINHTDLAHPHEYATYINALRQNQKVRDVHIMVAGGGSIDKEAATALGLYLKSSIVLETFSLDYFRMDLEIATEICQGIRQSKSLKKLSIKQTLCDFWDLFVDELASNSNIVDAEFGSFQSDRMDYFLAHNRYGLVHLFDPSFPAQLLPLVFARQLDDRHAASCVYACLQESPHFLSTIAPKMREN